ncbi:DCC1-like thiol-disulfide oxidoreductase family protein [Shewanella sp.]|uniref:thiol-disulfide oxidoreductase DCC family protein n=1 Tax=Shewanella sp. TaxID=50422 RepID=UPI000C11128D|nr:DCC1-like thiol-disulfide oxidoreductase family protein [Shewanella sp.]MCJ8305262.1 DCC1-like thiol-disulfide oxidoreductase family protein [Shewanella sp.]PHQ75805.1 MAG: thiol-disulfide oxidoreductase [Shewanella sp.]
METRNIIIFDGVCNLCNGAVNFIIKRDPKQNFCFTPMQSQAAKDLMSRYSLVNDYGDTFFLIKQGKCYTRTDAALEICKDLSGLWPLLKIFSVLPRSFRNYCYNWLGSRRYSLFGKRDTCMLPTDDLRSRFID